MAIIEKISQKAPASKAMDYAALRDEAITHIQQLAGNVWTDYNSHDPGVTILEHLIYGITDAAHRSNYDIKHLLAENVESSDIPSHLFTACDILTTSPVSLDDYRRLLINVAGVKNAWLEPQVSNDFYSDGPTFHRSEKELTYDQLLPTTQSIRLNGLYDVLLEFEIDPDHGDLNSNSVTTVVDITDPSHPLHGLRVELFAIFAYWDEPAIDWSDQYQIGLFLQEIKFVITNKPPSFKIKIGSLKPEEGQYKIVSEIKDQNYDRQPNLEKKLTALLTKTIFGPNGLTYRYQQKVNSITHIVNRVNKELHNNRNLCEDFIRIKSLRVIEIALCMKIDLEHDADPDQVLAQLFHRVKKFLSPDLAFKDLAEMEATNLRVDEIFDGPKPTFGFLDDTQLQLTDRRTMIYISDLINVINDIEGITFIASLEVAKRSKNGFEEPKGDEQWHLSLYEESNHSQTYLIPRLNQQRSTVKFYKDGIPQPANHQTANALLENLENKQSRIITTKNLDLPIPKGVSKSVNTYHSLQLDFPETYQIGERGIGESEPELRKSQARQLKGYLLIFEQLLANFNAQLSHLNQLFSLDRKVNQTYFSNPLYQVPDVQLLLRDFLCLFPADLDNKIPDNLQNKWNRFLNDDQNTYLQKLSSIIEGSFIDPITSKTKSVFEDRRNRFLDHVLARFGESIKDYAQVMHLISRQQSPKTLIQDKINLMSNYATISANRSRGCNYRVDPTLHHAHQKSGLEQRVARLLGIDLDNKQELIDAMESYVDKAGKYRFRLRDTTNEIILNSEKGYKQQQDIDRIIDLVVVVALEEKYYQKKTNRNGKYYFNLQDASGEIIARGQDYFHTEAERDEEIQRVLEFVGKFEERLFVIEHLLLRPRIKAIDQLLPVHDQTNYSSESMCCPGNNDPYSFTISVYLPSWPVRFRHLDFRKHVERKIRLETPAHIYPKICWINRSHFFALQSAYLDWKNAFAQCPIDEHSLIESFEQSIDEEIKIIKQLLSGEKGLEKIGNGIDAAVKLMKTLKRILKKKSKATDADTELLRKKLEKLKQLAALINRSNKLNELIESMTAARTVYPEAHLYDCLDSDTENPVSLDNTILGTFKPLEDDE